MSEKKELSIKTPNQTCRIAVKALISAVPYLGVKQGDGSLFDNSLLPLV